MAFKIYATRGPGTRLSEGQASLGKFGALRMAAGDLGRAELGKVAVVLCDAATQRIALRAPREGREFAEPTLMIKWAKRATSGCANLRGPLRSMGIDSAAVAGVHDVLHKDGLLIVNLGGGGGPGAKGPAKGKKARKA